MIFNIDTLFNDDDTPQRKRKGRPPRARGLHQFTVQKPYCAPARDQIYSALEPYGIPILHYDEQTASTSLAGLAKRLRIEAKAFESIMYAYNFLPMAQEATFQVPKQQAAWAEYLLESTNKLVIVRGRVDQRNRTWGNRRAGRMPTPWNARQGQAYAQAAAGGLQKPPDGQPWIEQGCSQGKEAWGKVTAIVKKEQEKKKQ